MANHWEIKGFETYALEIFFFIFSQDMTPLNFWKLIKEHPVYRLGELANILQLLSLIPMIDRLYFK